MLKKILIIVACVVLVACIFLLNNIKFTQNSIYATNISVENTSFSVQTNSVITKDDYNLTILPANYNKGIIYRSSNESVAIVDKNGNISCLNSYGTATINIFAKYSANETISATIVIVVENNSVCSLEHSSIEMQENSTSTNNLTLSTSPNNVEISYLTNLTIYNYQTGEISINPNDDYKFGYDKVFIKLYFNNNYVVNLSFEVIVIKTVYILNTQPYLLYFNNFITDNIQISYSLSNNNITAVQQNFNNCLIIANNSGETLYTIYCNKFTIKVLFIITLT